MTNDEKLFYLDIVMSFSDALISKYLDRYDLPLLYKPSAFKIVQSSVGLVLLSIGFIELALYLIIFNLYYYYYYY